MPLPAALDHVADFREIMISLMCFFLAPPKVGIPSDSNQYVHRLGRTARAGKGGSGLLVLMEAEKGFIREVRAVPHTLTRCTFAHVVNEHLRLLQDDNAARDFPKNDTPVT